MPHISGSVLATAGRCKVKFLVSTKGARRRISCLRERGRTDGPPSIRDQNHKLLGHDSLSIYILHFSPLGLLPNSKNPMSRTKLTC